MMSKETSLGKKGTAALRLAAECGWAAFPCWGVTDGKCDCGNSECSSAGKHPLSAMAPNGFKNATTDEQFIKESWNRFPNANVGIATGNPSGMFVVDIDQKNGGSGIQQFADLSPDGFGYDSFDETPKSVTGSGGLHIVFQMTDSSEVRNGSKLGGLDIDCRGNGGYIIAPPSVNCEGIYRWEISPFDFEPDSPPDYILDLVTGKSQAKQSSENLLEGLSFTVQYDLQSHPGSPKGERNATLCKLVGSYLACNGIDNDLIPLAVAWGQRGTPPYPQKEVQKTVVMLAEKHARQEPAKSPSRVVLTPYSKINPECVDWLWQDRVAIGKLTIVSGDPGLGKTFILLDIAARISTGREFPDGAKCDWGKVIILTAEDGAGDTIRPRLDAMSANVGDVFHFEGISNGTDDLDFFQLDQHLAELNSAISELENVRLVVIDPISAYMGKCDSHNNTDVRRVLAPLARLAEEQQSAVVAISHLTKASAQSKAIYRTMGSLAFVAAARAAWGVIKDPEDDSRRLFLPIKNNLAESSGLAYRIEEGRVEWEPDPVTVSIDDLEDAGADERPKTEAKAWLLAKLKDGPVPATDILKAAKADGISKRTLERAKKELGVKSEQTAEGWMWFPPQKLVIGGEEVQQKGWQF